MEKRVRELEVEEISPDLRGEGGWESRRGTTAVPPEGV
jgi:hypothetical protein